MSEETGRTILVVADQPDEGSLSRILTERGYRVRSLRADERVLPRVLESPPDLILLDIGTPDARGQEICRALKAEERSRDIPVIFVGDPGRPTERARIFSAGAVDYAPKPYCHEELLARVETHLELPGLRRKLEAQNELLFREAEDRKLIEVALRLNEERLDALLRLSESRDMTEADLDDFVLRECVRLTRSEMGYLHFVNEGQDGFISYVWSKGAAEDCGVREEKDLSLGTAGIWADSLRLSRPVVHNDYASEPSRKGLPEGHVPIVRHMGVPIIKGTRVVAVCGVANKPTPYDEADQRQLLLFMNRLWSIIENKRAEIALAKMNAELQRLASIDGLTGIANRRSFDEFLAMQWKLAAREREPLALLMADIDFFKLYNDTYGHLAGDDVLKRIALVVAEAARRPSDLVARYGGEEFVAVLPRTGAEGAVGIAETLVEKAMDLRIPHSRSNVSQCVTLSVGVGVAVPSAAASFEALVGMADRALYEAKRLGRNRAMMGPS